MTAASSNRSLRIRASALMAAGSLFSRLLGFVRNFMLGMVMGGTGTIAFNAFSSANILPSSLWILIGGGTLNAILVPAIVRAMDRPDGGSDYMSRLVTLVLLVTGGLTAISMLLVNVLLVVANSNLDPVTMRAATTLAYFLLPQMLTSAMYVMFGQILNAHESFGPFQWAPALNNLAAILLSVLFFVVWGSQPDPEAWTWPMVFTLAGAQLFGSLVQGLFLWYWTYRIGLRIRLKWGFRGLGLRTLGKLGAWTLGMLVLGQLGVFTTRWASAGAVRATAELQGAGKLEEASRYAGLASLDLSYTVFMIPQGIIVVALVTSVFSAISRHARDGEHAQAYAEYTAMGRVLMVPMLLCTVVFSVLAAPMMWVAVGGTSRISAEANGLVLTGYMLGLLPFASLYLMKRFFYAYEDARMSFLVQIPILVVSALAVIPIRLWVDPLYATATATAVTSLGTLVAWLVGLGMLRRKLAALGVQMTSGSRTTATFICLMIATLASGAVGALLLMVAGDLTWHSRPVAVIVGGVIGAIMTAVYAGVAHLLGVEEIRAAWSTVMRRLRR